MNRYKDAKKASIFGIIGNSVLFIIKIISSIVSGSESMLADAFNSGSDIFSSIVTIIGNRISSKPKDKDHNLGHGKAEYIFSLMISMTMVLIGLSITKSSFMSLLNKNEVIYSPFLIGVCLITIVVKILLYVYTDRIYRKHNNLLIKAASKDHRNDILITTLNLISIIMSKNKIYFIDGFIGIVISMWIIVTAIKLFKESYDVLMDKTISEEARKEVLEIVDRHPEIKKVQHFIGTPIGYKYQISLTIFVDGNLTTFASHKIADDLEKEITSQIDEIYLAIIHVNPI